MLKSAFLPKIVLVRKETRLQGLRRRFNTAAQAKFYIEHMHQDFGEYEAEDAVYESTLSRLQAELGKLDRKVHVIDRTYLTNYLFDPADVVVTAGPDGLVVNTAKYLEGQPIVAVNPDPKRIDGILLPFSVHEAPAVVARAIRGAAPCHDITMAEASLNDGQKLLAFNDFLIGHSSHVSARYRLDWAGRREEQSSSGVLVATGAGSTGWFSSMQNMARSVASFVGSLKGPRWSKGQARLPVLRSTVATAEAPSLRLAWEDPRLIFVVREPFASRTSGTVLTAGLIEPGQELRLESRMPEHGVIFSDGIEADALAFNSGAAASIRASSKKTRLVKRA